MPKVKVIADSTCDLGPALAAARDMDIVPLYVSLGGESYRDGVEITTPQLLARCERAKETPKTAATSVGDFLEAFRPYAQAGREIVFLSVSGHMSAQIENARLAAAELPDAVIRCVDSQNLSTGIGLLALEAAERAEAGMDAEGIAREIEALRPKVNASFVIDTLAFLHRGGRCSGLMAFGASILNIKPQIGVADGKMSPVDKFRGDIFRVVPRYVDKQLANLSAIRPERVFVTHCGWPAGPLREVVEGIRSLNYFREVLVTTAGCVIASHCGPNTLGVLFIEK